LNEDSKPKQNRPPPGRCLSNLDSSSFEEGQYQLGFSGIHTFINRPYNSRR
jgi:hypothetical protein